jgi:Amt family ammonium transporter
MEGKGADGDTAGSLFCPAGQRDFPAQPGPGRTGLGALPKKSLERQRKEADYSGFAISDVTETGMLENENTDLGEDSAEKATPAQLGAAVKVFRQPEVPAPASTGMYKVVMIVKLSKFDTLKTALNNLGVTGMTVSQVMGCGIQRGTTEKYRGVPVDSTLLPKVKVEVVVSKLPVDAVIAAAKSALYTGHIGDGKIFVYPVSRVVKIRTNEENFAALQDVE